MARDTELLKLRDKHIRNDFDRLSGQRTKEGRRKYTVEYVIWQLSRSYYLSEKTVERVVYSGGSHG